jgi:hypothetical protein
MNLGVPILAILLGAGAILVLIMGAAAQPQEYSDTYGNAMPSATNNTQGVIINQTAPVAAFGSGAVIFLGILVLAIAAIGLYAIFAHRGGSRYSSRYG